ncbi:MAG: hypothetical protein LC725_09800, partial [Lentisphaerae bacterium]|nr:hypothetical protein [Lentisphaerota bacterium]
MSAPATSTATLTEDQRTEAQRLLMRFFLINGIVVTCVMENILLLWALQNDLSAAHVAVITTFSMLTMPMMLAGKRISAALGLARAWSLAWFYRYFFVLAMLPAPWLRGTAMAPVAPWLITICIFGLFSMRSIGMVNNLPIIGGITTRDDQGSFQAKVTLRSYSTYFVGTGCLVGLLHWRDTPATFQIILLCGSLLGMYSASLLRRLPELDDSRDAARVGLLKIIRHMLQSVTLRRLAAGWCGTAVATALIVPIAMLAVKRGYNVPDNTALFFTLLELAGSIVAAYALTVIADHTGPRPILILS